MGLTRQYLNTIIDIFYPEKCISCGKYGNHLCFGCASKIEKIATSTCPECGKIIKFGSYCPDCKKNLGLMINGIMSAAIYDAGPTKEIIHHLKYSGFVDLAGILGELMVERLLHEAMPNNCVIVPVPLSLKRVAERGFNQSELIGKYVSNKLRIPGCDALSRIKDQKPQATLKRNERLSNLIGVFRVEDDEFVHGKNVLLIDDVATTGTTLNECAKVLRAAGAKKVYGVVVAHG